MSYYIDIFTGNSISDGEKSQYETPEGIPYIATKDINIDYATVDYDNGMRVPFDSDFKIAKAESVLLCIEGGSAGKKIAFIDRDVAFVNKLCAFKARIAFANKYLYYYIYSDAFVAPFNLSMTGLIGGVSQTAIRGLKIVIPKEKDQQKIADFLDDKCAKIDSLISHEEATIEELKAYKQSVITEAVTKGLDKSVPMKSSGVEWIGEIPAHWKVIATKRLFAILSGATPKSDNAAFWDGDIVWITPADYKTGDVFVREGRRNITEIGLQSCNTTLIPLNSIIFSKRAPIGAVAINSNELCTNQGCLSCIAFIELIIKYYYYLMSVCTEQYELLGTGTTFNEISLKSFSDFPLLFPTIQEQQQIADYLDKKCAEIDNLISIKQQKIEELKEYKKSLIYEYVTGKKEVV